MPPRVKLLVSSVLLASLLAGLAGARLPAKHWFLFLIYIAAVLLSSGMKVSLPSSDSSLSVNFPFILLAVLQLSPLQAMAVAAISVFAQCKFRVEKLFSLVKTGFNIANAVNATALCWLTYVSLRELHLSAAPALTAGAIVYFVASTLPVAVVVAWTSNQKALALWRSGFLWFLPFYLVGAALSALAHFLSQHYGLPTALLVVPAAYTIYRSYNAQIAHMRDREKHIAEMEALHLRTIESLAMAIEAKDQDTHDHLLRVRVYVTELGKALRLTEAELQAVKTAALLHDIGKLAVPERIINKPGKLTAEEFEKMKIHPVVGADILERVRFPYPVVPIVRAHHEWWNGMGYPDGLRGDAIPIGARILTVVDSFDAMASDRPYRRAMPLAEAMAIVRKLAGSQFDPQVVDALEQQYERLEAEARLESEKLLRLNTEVSVSRGLAPGAGFEQDSAEADAQLAAPAGQTDAAASEESSEASPDFTGVIAAVQTEAQLLLSRCLSGSPSFVLEEALAVLATHLAPLIPYDCLVLYVKQGEILVPKHAGALGGRYFSAEPLQFGDGLSGWTALHEHSIVNGNPAVEPNYRYKGEAAQSLRSALSLPLRDEEHSLFGVLSLYAFGGNAFARLHLRALEAAEQPIALLCKHCLQRPEFVQRPEILEEARAAAQNALPPLDAALQRCRDYGEPFAVLACDLGGDRDPRTYVERLTLLECGPADVIAQQGSTSFLLLAGVTTAQSARRAAALQQPARLTACEGASLPPAAVGSAHSSEGLETGDALLACAERRMHQLQQEALTLPVGVS